MSIPTFIGQHTPGVPGFPDYTVDLASAELPCGASWIGSVLLELGVPTFNPWGADTRDEWQAMSDGRFRYQRPDEGWSRLLPGLRHGREFRFMASPVPRLGHHWPGQYARLPALLVVRDPRDALYSAWRRERALGALPAVIDFQAFLRWPFRQWMLSWTAYLCLHTAAWRRFMRQHGGLVLRFEDFKANPMAEARKVLDWLQLPVSDDHLQIAVATSDHQQIKHAEANLLATGVAPSAMLAGGVAEEWRTHYTPALHAALPDWLWRCYLPMGYAPAHPGIAAAPPDLDALRQVAATIPLPLDQLSDLL